RHFLVGGVEEGRGERVYLLDIDGGKPRPITPENYRGVGPISTAGKRFLARGPDGKAQICSVDGGTPPPVPGLQVDELPAGWTADDRAHYVQAKGGPGARIDRLDLATGRRELWKEILPSDPTGVIRTSSVLISPDGTFYAYAYSRVLSNLFLVEGLK